MSVLELPEWMNLSSSISAGGDCWTQAVAGLPLIGKVRKQFKPLLVQEQAGFHLGIGSDIANTARHAAQILLERYRQWMDGKVDASVAPFKQRHFTIAVGGGNTLKNEYKALLKYHFHDIDWITHIRFFFLEETCGGRNWELSRDSLVENLVEPLANRLVVTAGSRKLTQQLGLKRSASRQAIVRGIIDHLIYPIDISGVSAQIARGKREAALSQAQEEARRYQRLLREKLGPDMSFHMIISGISKNGGIGAFEPYTPELRKKKPGVIALEKNSGAVSVALNRGVLVGADCVSMIIAGSLKLRALGRFEMDDSARFEQTVTETPIRMLRASRDIAERVYIFADNRALHFDEGVFRYQEDGQQLTVKSEVREGDEDGGIHILLVHGFMGLYSYINLLIGLPSAWKVSALRRGKHAKTLPDEDVFPHYARTLKKMILRDWRAGRPTPICCHSMGGVVSDHLLLSMLNDYDGDLPEFDDLKVQDRQLIEALRAGGMVHIATWAPSDICHIRQNVDNLKTHRSENTPLDFSGPAEFYELTADGALKLKDELADKLMSTPAVLEKLLRIPGTESMINSINVVLRFLAGRLDLQKFLKQEDAPYGQRLLSDRVLKKVSFYGVLKELNAAMHHPRGYQERHLKALNAIVKYDIPYLAIVHRDDFMVSANRHVEEHEYLLKARLEKEGVKRESELKVPTRLILLRGEKEEPEVELVDPHFLILSHSHEGGVNARKVTAAMTQFVNENAARAIARGDVESLASIDKFIAGSRR